MHVQVRRAGPAKSLPPVRRSPSELRCQGPTQWWPGCLCFLLCACFSRLYCPLQAVRSQTHSVAFYPMFPWHLMLSE